MHFASNSSWRCALLSLLLARPEIALAFLPIQSHRQKTRALFATNDLEIGIGIDLGTTYSAVAILNDDGMPTIVPIPDNGRTIASVVHLRGPLNLDTADSDHGETVLVGQAAASHDHAYRNVKRVIGTGGKISQDIVDVVPHVLPSKQGKTFKKDSLLHQLEDAMLHPTMLQSTFEQNARIAPELISSCIIHKLKTTAQDYAGGKLVTRAVIGVPAYFNDAQRQATKRAAELAGIKKVKLLREPEAAALAYGIGKVQAGITGTNQDDGELVLVFDLGGGTFDVSMLVVGGGLTEIVSTSGNVNLGGADFDNRIAQYLSKLIGGTKKWSEQARNKLILTAEKIRIYLSNNRKANLALPLKEDAWIQMIDPSTPILPMDWSEELSEVGQSNSTHILFDLPRKSMERLCHEEFQALLRPIREVAIMSGALLPGDSRPTLVEAALAMEEADQQADNLDFPEFYNYHETGTSKTEHELLLQLQEFEMKEAKKAQQRGRKKARDVAKQEKKYRSEKRKIEQNSPVSSRDENVKIRDGITGRPISRVVLVGGATRMPGIGRLVAALTGVVPQKTVNPDEAVALGCAVHVGVLDGVEGMGTVLSPMQAAILRAVAEKNGFFIDDAFDDEDEFQEIEML